jgi:hypothetical protein
VSKGVYRTSIPNNLLELIKLQLDKINSKQIIDLIDKMIDTIENNAVLYKKEYDQALNNSLESVKLILKENLISMFVESLEKPLENLKL